MSKFEVNDSRPQVPPDSHGSYGKYCDQGEEHNVKCAHDIDECSFIEFCPKYEPEDHNDGEYNLAPKIPNKLVATCRLASDGSSFLNVLFSYDCGCGLLGFIEPIDNNDENNFELGKLETKYNMLSFLEKDMLELLAMLKFGGYKDYIELVVASINLRLKRRAGQ